MRSLLVASLAGLLGALGAPSAPAADGSADPGARAGALTDVSSQDTRRPRIRPRITVRPGGRLLYRQCDFRLVREVRLSGTYVVPRQHCWWVRAAR